MTDQSSSKKTILAFVGMPGAGKTEAAAYLVDKGIPFVRFGDLTDEGVADMGLPLTADNERKFREHIREELGMAAYAIKADPKINELLLMHNVIAIDGLRSWEEYLYLIKKYSGLTLINVYAEPSLRYKRLESRKVRSFTLEEARNRDIAELENLNMGGPIAIADHLIINNTTREDLHIQIDTLLSDLL